MHLSASLGRNTFSRCQTSHRGLLTSKEARAPNYPSSSSRSLATSLRPPKVTPKILRRPFVRKRWVCGACAVGTSHIYCAPPPPIALLHWLVRGKAGALTASHQRKVAERRRGKKGGKKVVVRRRKSAFATASQEGGGEERSLCPGLPAKSQQKKNCARLCA